MQTLVMYVIIAPLVSLKCTKTTTRAAYNISVPFCVDCALMEGMSRSLKLSLVSIVLLTCVHIGATQDDGESLYLNGFIIVFIICVDANLSAAVHKILLPIMKEIKDDLNSVKNDLSSFNKTVNTLSGDLEDYKQQTSSQLSSLNNTQNLQLGQLYTKIDMLNSKLDSVNTSMQEKLRAMESQLEEHQMQTTSELAGLQRNVTSQLQTSYNEELITKIDTLDSNLVSVNASMREGLRAIESQLEVHESRLSPYVCMSF